MNFLEQFMRRILRSSSNGRSREGNPSRFDGEVQLHVQTAAIRRAEERRQRRGVRNLRNLYYGGFPETQADRQNRENIAATLRKMWSSANAMGGHRA